jgi:hypothetical protein
VHDAGVMRLRARWLGRVSRRAGKGRGVELSALGGGLRAISSGEYIVVGMVWGGLGFVRRWVAGAEHAFGEV